MVVTTAVARGQLIQESSQDGLPFLLMGECSMLIPYLDGPDGGGNDQENRGE